MTASISKRLFAHGGVYGIARVISQGSLFLLLPLYDRYLGKEGFGIVSLMGAVGTFLGLIFIQGLHGSWFRLRFDETDAPGLRSFESTIIWYLACSISAGVALLLVVGPWLAPYVTPNVPYYPFGLLTILYAAATVLVTLVERKFQAEQRPAAFAIFSITRTLMMLGTILIFVGVFRWGAEGKLRADLLSAVVLAVVALVCIAPGGPRYFSRGRLSRSLAYGLPLIPHHVAGFANDMIDRVLVNRMIDLEATGVYSMGYRVGAVGLLVAMSMNQAYAPLFVRAMKEVESAQDRGDDHEAREALNAVAQAALLSVSLIACIALGATAVAREALLVVAPNFGASWRVVAIVAAATVAWSAYFPFAQPIAYDVSRVRYLSLVTVAGAIVNILANIVMIRWFGMVGAAWATLLSSIVLALLALKLGLVSVAVPYRFRRWFNMLILCAVGLFAIWLLDVSVTSLAMRLSCKLLVAAVAAVGCTLATGARWSDVQRLLGRK